MTRKTMFEIVLFVLLFTACAPLTAQPQISPTMASTPDYSTIVDNATELRQENLYLVTLKFKKNEFTLDLSKQLKNELAAEYKTIIVSEESFNSYTIGQEISSVSDTWGFVFNGEFASYSISVSEKNVVGQYFWNDTNNHETEITSSEYEGSLQDLKSKEISLLTVPYSGITITYVLDKPLSEYTIISRQDLNRYFITVKVENTTFTLDLTKQIRNAANTHEITLEVTESVYTTTGDVWNSEVSEGSLIFKGHLSSLSGTVINRWTTVDPQYEIVTTEEGKQFIVHK